jgi:hypothetical protein
MASAKWIEIPTGSEAEEKAAEQLRRRNTAGQTLDQSQPNGIWIKIALAVVGITITGAVGGLVAWGGMGVTQESHEKRLEKLENSSSSNAIGQARIEARLDSLQQELTEIKALLRGRRR